MDNTNGNYKSVNGLEMYYEVHGEGKPLVLLHGGLSSIGMFYLVLPELAKTRQVIAVEQQGHGHTADIDRPLSFAQMADDTAELLKQLDVKGADVLGYSDGGLIALHLAVHHPEVVEKLVLASSVYDINGYYPPVVEGLRNPSPDGFPPIMRESYEQIAPKPDWAGLVEKVAKATLEASLSADDVKAINVPALVVRAKEDIMMPEHTKQLGELLNAEVVEVEGDHASYVVMQPQEFLEKLQKFLG